MKLKELYLRKKNLVSREDILEVGNKSNEMGVEGEQTTEKAIGRSRGLVVLRVQSVVFSVHMFFLSHIH